jgi:hypothetical protein
MTALGGFSEGQHVVLRRDLRDWLGARRLRRGTRGIVRSRPAGLFGDRYEVEFPSGEVRQVPGRQLRPALYGHGEEAWRRYRAHRAGFKLGLLILALPAIAALARYYLHGGSTSGLVAALPAAALAGGARLLEGLVGLIGLPVVLLLAVAWMWMGRRR